jgi:hypothetical protein
MLRTSRTSRYAPGASRTTPSTQTIRSQACRSQRLKITQEQAGHRYASTTTIYTGVSDDYRNRLVRRSLEARPELWEGAL